MTSWKIVCSRKIYLFALCYLCVDVLAYSQEVNTSTTGTKITNETVVKHKSAVSSDVINEEKKKPEFSVDFFVGASSILTGRSSGKNENYNYHYIPAYGFGGDWGYSVTSKLSAHAALGFLQRGAEFDSVSFADQGRYRLSYIDLWGYLEYTSGSQIAFTFLAGLTQSTLVSAGLTLSDVKSNAMDNFKRIDLGLMTGPGILFPTTNNNEIRLRFIFSYGFRDAFAERHFNDDIKAHNHAIFVQMGYVFN